MDSIWVFIGFPILKWSDDPCTRHFGMELRLLGWDYSTSMKTSFK